MKLWGQLEVFSILEVIQFLQSAQKSGLLKLTSGDRHAELLFFQGSILTGSVDHRTFSATSAAPTREEMCEALGHHIQRVIQTLLDWREGTFTLVPSDITDRGPLEGASPELLLPHEMRTEFLVMEALRNFDEQKQHAKTKKSAFYTPEMPLKKYLFHLHLRRKTVKVHVRSHKHVRTLIFEDGEVVLVLSNIPEENLGLYLVHNKILSMENLSEIQALVNKTKKRQGEVIVERGYLNAFQMFEHLKSHMHDKLRRCLMETDAQVQEENYSPDELIMQKFPMDFFRVMVDSFAVAETSAHDALGAFYLGVNQEGERYLKSKALTPNEARLIKLLDGRMRYDDIMLQCQEFAAKAKQLIDFIGYFDFLTFAEFPKTES